MGCQILQPLGSNDYSSHTQQGAAWGQSAWGLHTQLQVCQIAKSDQACLPIVAFEYLASLHNMSLCKDKELMPSSNLPSPVMWVSVGIRFQLPRPAYSFVNIPGFHAALLCGYLNNLEPQHLVQDCRKSLPSIYILFIYFKEIILTILCLHFSLNCSLV